MTPILQTGRLLLVPYRAGMVTDQRIGWLNNKDRMKYSEQRYDRHTIESQHEWVNGMQNGAHAWVIQTRAGLHVWGDTSPEIGTVTAYVDHHNRVANMGILLGESPGQGFATEAWKGVMDWLFKSGMRKVECGCREDNTPMRKLALRVGMSLEASIPAHFLDDDGRPHGLMIYGIAK